MVDDFKEEYVKKAWPQMKEYFEMDKSKLRKHCREVGIDYRGFEKLNAQFRLAMSILVGKKYSNFLLLFAAHN
ncbi:MAG: hypothetical protein IPL04_02700 [Chitinophagaceae bacterium]|nr:hypothetical protein [Chitinophagaceae bacterium]